MERSWRLAICLISLIMVSLCITGSAQKTIKLVNDCNFTVWPKIASWNTHDNDLPANLPTTLVTNNSSSFKVNSSWEGSIWGRFGTCKSDSGGNVQCDSDDCGAKVGCTPNAITMVNFMNGSYDVSLVSGYNLPISVQVPEDNNGCQSRACNADLVSVCPKELQVVLDGGVLSGCNGTCNTYLRTCSPPDFSSAFQKACPQATPFTFDSVCPPTTTYTLTFCPKQ